MAQNVATDIIKLNSAKRGVSGSETITGARRLAHRETTSGRRIPGAKMTSDYRTTYEELTLGIETTKELERSKHQAVAVEEQLVIEFDDGDGTVTRTYYRVRKMGAGESLFPAPEEDGPAGTRELQFIVLEAVEGEGLDTAYSDVRS